MACGPSWKATTGRPLLPVKHFELTQEDREKAIQRAGDKCEKCGWLAWSYARQAELVVGPHPKDPEKLHVVCPNCSAISSAKYASVEATPNQKLAS